MNKINKTKIEAIAEMVRDSISKGKLHTDYDSILELCREIHISSYALQNIIMYELTCTNETVHKHINRVGFVSVNSLNKVNIESISTESNNREDEINERDILIIERDNRIVDLTQNLEKEKRKKKRLIWSFRVIVIILLFLFGMVLYVILNNPKLRHELYLLFP